LSKQIEDLQKDCLRNLADRQNEVDSVPVSKLESTFLVYTCSWLLALLCLKLGFFHYFAIYYTLSRKTP